MSRLTYWYGACLRCITLVSTSSQIGTELGATVVRTITTVVSKQGRKRPYGSLSQVTPLFLELTSIGPAA